MSFTLKFLSVFFDLLGDGWPLFAGLASIISALALVVGQKEGWSIGDSLYFGFITALTVGYGDSRPTRGVNKLLAVVIALFGLVTPGIMVATAVEAALLVYEPRLTMDLG